jgi:hypothetical protein
MITTRAFELKQKHDRAKTLKKRCHYATMLVNELVYFCRPEENEFELVMEGTTITSKGLYQLLLHTDTWKQDESIADKIHLFLLMDEWARTHNIKL